VNARVLLIDGLSYCICIWCEDLPQDNVTVVCFHLGDSPASVV
jgi:hypothetical protein